MRKKLNEWAKFDSGIDAGAVKRAWDDSQQMNCNK